MRKKIAAAACSRRISVVGRGLRKAHEGIVRRSAMCKFSGCGCRFNPGFGETEEVRWCVSIM